MPHKLTEYFADALGQHFGRQRVYDADEVDALLKSIADAQDAPGELSGAKEGYTSIQSLVIPASSAPVIEPDAQQVLMSSGCLPAPDTVLSGAELYYPGGEIKFVEGKALVIENAAGQMAEGASLGGRSPVDQKASAPAVLLSARHTDELLKAVIGLSRSHTRERIEWIRDLAISALTERAAEQVVERVSLDGHPPFQRSAPVEPTEREALEKELRKLASELESDDAHENIDPGSVTCTKASAMLRVDAEAGMSRRGVINVEPNAVCEYCAAYKELRPYGPNGERICFECGMKDEETTKRRFKQHVFGEGFDA